MPKEKLLLVEDDMIIQVILKTKLEKKFLLILAQDGAEGFQKALREKPDLIISDIMMPQIDGFELKNKIRAVPELNLIPFIFLTSKSDPESRIKGLMSGADDYLFKPVDVSLLIKRIRMLLDRSRVYREESLVQFSREIQQTFLPNELPGIPGFDFHSIIQPACLGGGDFIDIVPINDFEYIIIQGDVMGKGIKAKFFVYAFMGYLRGLLHATLSNCDRISLAEIVNRFSRLVDQDSFLQDIFITFILMTLDLKHSRLVYCNAGYTRNFLIRNQGSKIIELTVGGGIPGFYQDDYNQESLDLAYGDLVCLYSDGVSEAKNPDGKMFGETPIVEYILGTEANTTKNISEGMLNKINSFTANYLQKDDISITIFINQEKNGEH